MGDPEARPPLRAAIIGCGSMGWRYDETGGEGTVLTHAKAYARNPSVALEAVCDLRRDAAESCADRWGGVPFTDSHRLLEECSPDLVSVCTSTESHLELLELCLGSSVAAVWCEKPLASVGQDPEPVVTAYEEAGKVLAVNYLRRWEPEHARVGLEIREGALGRVDKAVAFYSKGFLHSGSHFVDLFRSWFGEVADWEVLGTAVDVLEDDPNVDVLLRFEDGPAAYLLATDERSYSMDEVHLFAEEKRIRIADYSRSVLWYPRTRGSITGTPALGSEPEVRTTSMDRLMETVLDDIIGAVRSSSTVVSDGRTALGTFRVCERIATSI